MAKSENQKLKTLYVAKYFMEYSDENHPVRAKDICDYLNEEYGIEVDRRAIYRDIAALRDAYGMDIDGVQGGKYRLLSHPFDFEDLRLLAECVYATKFISMEKATELIDELGQLCTTYQAEELQREVFLCDRVKTTRTNVHRMAGYIQAAMAKKQDGKPHVPQKISFKYLKYALQEKAMQVEKYQGALYKVSPYKLLISDGNYYLLAFDDKSQDMRTYRVDRMKDIQLLNEPRDGAQAYEDLNIETYTRRVFSMFGGEKKRVNIRFDLTLLDTAIERFGVDGDVFYRIEDDRYFIVSADVEISDQFLAWVCGFRDKAMIISPPEVIETMEKFLKDIAKEYKSK